MEWCIGCFFDLCGVEGGIDRDSLRELLKDSLGLFAWVIFSNVECLGILSCGTLPEVVVYSAVEVVVNDFVADDIKDEGFDMGFSYT